MPRAASILLLFALWPLTVGAQEPAPVDSLALARQYTQWLYDGQADSLLAHSSAWALERYATREEWQRRSEMIAEGLGWETSVLDETWKLVNARCQYWRTAQFTNFPLPFMIRWMLNEGWEIVGLQLSPASEAPAADADTCGGVGDAR